MLNNDNKKAKVAPGSLFNSPLHFTRFKCNAVNLKFDKYAIPSTPQRQLLIPHKHLPPTLSVLTLQQLLGANRFAVLPFGDPITRISISN